MRFTYMNLNMKSNHQNDNPANSLLIALDSWEIDRYVIKTRLIPMHCKRVYANGLQQSQYN